MFIIEGVKKWSKTERTALIKDGSEMSYAALEKRSESIAAYLLHNIKDKQPVIIWGDKDNDMVSCLIACLKSGRPYVMLPDYSPSERTKTIIAAAKPDLIFNISCEEIPVQDIKTVYAEELNDIVRQYDGVEVSDENWVKPDDLCCIFYTSGSTGEPKGVMLCRRNIEACLAWKDPLRDLSPDTENFGMRTTNVPSYSFVASVEKLYRDLGELGMTLYAIDRGLASDYKRLFDTIFEIQPHSFSGTPSLAEKCCKDPRFTEEYIRDMRLIILGGEVIPFRLAETLLTRFPKVNLLCSFGSTELTSGTIKCWITREMLRSGKQLPIGKTLCDSIARVVDVNGNELGDGEIGELVVVSDMAAMGYLNDPVRSTEKFFTAEDGRRGCRTGDLVWREGDVFYFVGRADNQVKVGGYRVEIEDVERHMRKVSLIKECAVAPVMDNERVAMLMAFVIPKDPEANKIQSIIAIKREMAAMVQPYMVPQKIVFVDNLPCNNNNKLDRHVLKEMAN